MSDIAITIPTPLQVTATMEGAEINIDLTYPASGGGVTVHSELTGRDAVDQHPISSITGLQTELDNINRIEKAAITATYTLQASDEGKMIVAEHAVTKIEIIVPNNLFTDFSGGYPVIAVRRSGLAEVEVISDGVSVVVGGANIAEQNQTITIDWENASTVSVTGGVE